MQILVIGSASNADEIIQKFGSGHTYLHSGTGLDIVDLIKRSDVVFDFLLDQHLIHNGYTDYANPVFFNTTLISLSDLLHQHGLQERDSFFGFCGLPSFVNRSVLEVSMSRNKNETLLSNICAQLSTDFVCVDDRVGFVTPRVICMIINEAYCTLEEGTANREDIDLAMKLGTNYPYGPFEWTKRIGINQVVQLLDAVHQDTHDDRYLVCDLLRKEVSNEK